MPGNFLVRADAKGPDKIWTQSTQPVGASENDWWMNDDTGIFKRLNSEGVWEDVAVGGSPELIVKTANQVTENLPHNVLQDVTQLVISFEENERVLFDGVLFFLGDSTAGIRLAFNSAAVVGAAFKWTGLGPISNTVTDANSNFNAISVDDTVIQYLSAGSVTPSVHIKGHVLGGSEAGNLQLRFASATSGVSKTILEGSHLKVNRI